MQSANPQFGPLMTRLMSGSCSGMQWRLRISEGFQKRLESHGGDGTGERVGFALRDEVGAAGGAEGVHALEEGRGELRGEGALDFDGVDPAGGKLQHQIDLRAGLGAVVAAGGAEWIRSGGEAWP